MVTALLSVAGRPRYRLALTRAVNVRLLGVRCCVFMARLRLVPLVKLSRYTCIAIDELIM